MRGRNNHLIIEENCYIGPDCSFWLEGSNLTIRIGAATSMTLSCHLNCQENSVVIELGKDCMLSNNIIIRTSDSHPIYNEKGERLNPPRSIKIGKHVWIAPNTKIMKGSIIGDNCIVGSDSTTFKTYPSNCLIVGRPAKIVKTDIHWTRESLF